jgi:UDP-glucose 4-epimerase
MAARRKSTAKKRTKSAEPGREAPLAAPEPRTPVFHKPVARSVAVTGACSFLGRNLVGLLEDDEHVGRIISLDVERPSTAGAKTRVYDLDLTQPTAEERTAEILAAERVDTVVHLAFLASPTHATAWAHELESVGTMHLLNACRRSEVGKLVMWSQTVLYGAHPTNPNFLSERHPLRARRDDPFFADKIDAEKEALRFGRPGKGRVVSVLRTAPILGPTVKNYVTQYLSRRFVPTVLGFDPLMQFVHEADAVTAFKLAVDRDVPGVFNVVADGVLPLSTVVKLAGRFAVPLPRPLATPVVSALWLAQLSEAPPALLDYLQYLCVADGAEAERALGFSSMYTTREAVIDYASAQHLRDVKLLSETPA